MPRSSIQAVLLLNSKDSEGNWIPTKVEINSWVTLHLAKKGGHAKDAAKHGATSIRGAYKAKVIKFETRGSVVSSVLVQHAYMQRQLQLDPSISIGPSFCNYLYPSGFEEWEDPTSIMGVIVVMHAEIGHMTVGRDRSPSQLLNDSIFFYNARYKLQPSARFGSLEPIPLPDFNSPEWPQPDMATTKAFRAKLREDFQKSIRPTIGSRATHLSWFMPISVFVDLFSMGINLQRTPTMFTYRNVTDDLYASLMDEGWSEKISVGEETMKTKINQASLRFRYHISKSTLYTNFVYNRWIQMRDLFYRALDQNQPIVMVHILCEVLNTEYQVEVGMTWSIRDVREKLKVQRASAHDADFVIWIVSTDGLTKVNSRNEKHSTVQSCMPATKET